jgi:hypothetical protein
MTTRTSCALATPLASAWPKLPKSRISCYRALGDALLHVGCVVGIDEFGKRAGLFQNRGTLFARFDVRRNLLEATFVEFACGELLEFRIGGVIHSLDR